MKPAQRLPAPERRTDVPDQIIGAAEAQEIQQAAANAHKLFAWIITHDHPGFVARFITSTPSIYVMRVGTLDELRGMLPSGLERSDHQPSDQAAVVEIWFGAPA